MFLLPLRPFLLTAAAALSAAAAVTSSASAAQPTDDALLAAIQLEAPATIAVAQVLPSAGDAHLAIRTRAQAADDSQSHDELWLAAGDGSDLEPVSRSAGSGAQYVSVASVGWSTDGRHLAFGYLNPAVKSATAAHVVDVDGIDAPRDLTLGAETTAPQFTADGRYVTFLQETPRTRSSGALDLASGGILFPARVDDVAIDGTVTGGPWLAPECARAAQPDWVPAVSTGRWLEQALASPDPGCRFGANAADPASTPKTATTNVQGASDAPATITRTVGSDLVTIADRTKPLGPTVRIRSSAKGLTRAIRRGLRIQLDLAGAKTVKAYVIAERPTDEDLLTPSRGTTFITLGRATFRELPSQTQTLAIPLTRDAKRGLPRFLKITVTVRIVAIDKAGNRTTVERNVALTDF
ncbi:MAG: hypothetical protein J7513_00585 [Solirubrobacteraceae bacterium]|nr:hypothetical protein [Solirubrobacteraceae bacterium]